MRRFVPAKPVDPQPIASIDMAALIGVLLVLLTALIASLPRQTDETEIEFGLNDLPLTMTPQWHHVMIASDGTLTLDGKGVDESALAAELPVIAANRSALLTLDTAPEAPYGRYVETLAVIERAGITQLGLSGNGPATR